MANTLKSTKHKLSKTHNENQKKTFSVLRIKKDRKPNERKKS